MSRTYRRLKSPNQHKAQKCNNFLLDKMRARLAHSFIGKSLIGLYSIGKTNHFIRYYTTYQEWERSFISYYNEIIRDSHKFTYLPTKLRKGMRKSAKARQRNELNKYLQSNDWDNYCHQSLFLGHYK